MKKAEAWNKILEVQYTDDGIRQMFFFSRLFHALNIVFFFYFERQVEGVVLHQNLTYYLIK